MPDDHYVQIAQQSLKPWIDGLTTHVAMLLEERVESVKRLRDRALNAVTDGDMNIMKHLNEELEEATKIIRDMMPGQRIGMVRDKATKWLQRGRPADIISWPYRAECKRCELLFADKNSIFALQAKIDLKGGIATFGGQGGLHAECPHCGQQMDITGNS